MDDFQEDIPDFEPDKRPDDDPPAQPEDPYDAYLLSLLDWEGPNSQA